jgi:hypothetical protein
LYSVFAVTDIDERITDKVTPEQLNLAMLFQGRGSGSIGRVPKFRSRGLVFVTLQEWNEQPAPSKTLIVQRVLGGDQVDDDLASILLSKGMSLGTTTPLPLSPEWRVALLVIERPTPCLWKGTKEEKRWMQSVR